ncbi:hypothetical protein LQZ18_03110 [Lachnospiraceae bacterium ZAX-1]
MTRNIKGFIHSPVPAILLDDILKKLHANHGGDAATRLIGPLELIVKNLYPFVKLLFHKQIEATFLMLSKLYTNGVIFWLKMRLNPSPLSARILFSVFTLANLAVQTHIHFVCAKSLLPLPPLGP